MRVLITADLHFNHARSGPLARELIGQMNQAGGDVLLLVGDTAGSDGDALERCLSLFRFAGPKLFVAGNHELWTHADDSYALYHEALPRRVRAAGWHWLEREPVRLGEAAFVGSVGWYGYSFAAVELGIPHRFYQAKLSPGAARRLGGYDDLFQTDSDISPAAYDVVARWNDGRYVKLGRSDEAFLDERLATLRTQLDSLAAVPTVVAAIHHLPFAELLPPSRRPQWDFAKAFLGSGRIGELLLKYPNVRRVYCGHSHFPAEAHIGHVHAVNIGSGYREKRFLTLDMPG